MIPIGETHDGRADMTNFEMDLFDTRMPGIKLEKTDDDSCCGLSSSRNRIIKPACVPISIISMLIIALVFLPLFNEEDLASPFKLPIYCSNSCSLTLVESVPTGLILPPPHHNSTVDAWVSLIDNARKYIDVSAMYWNLNTSDYATANAGRRVFDALIRAGQRGVKVRIAQDAGSNLSDNAESKYLADNKLAEVRSVNVTRLIGSGIIHTKFIIADIESVYIGSANMDWKSLAEVKELGVVIGGCPCVAADLYRIFAVYWKLGENASVVPAHWPISYRTQFNFSHPADVRFNGLTSNSFISSSPGPFNPKGREHDLEAIRKVIGAAKRSVCVSVMDYLPQTIYSGVNNSFWPLIDDALRDAAFRGAAVRLLISHWAHSRPAIVPFLRSLLAINDALPSRSGQKGSISVKIFTVPATPEQKKIPFARVNHAKYMVADDTAYIGTSNWSGDYFTSTAGVALVVRQANAASRLQAVFDRDWNSTYATLLS